MVRDKIIENYRGGNVNGSFADTSITPNKVMSTPQPTFQSPEVRRRRQKINNIKFYKTDIMDLVI